MHCTAVIVDDHQLFVDGLNELLAAKGVEVIATASDGLTAARLIRDRAPDIAIVDIGLPGLNGVEVARLILRDSPRTRVIVLTMHADEAYVFEALRAGIQGYVLKSQAFSDLDQAISTVLNGSVYLSPGISRTVMDAAIGGAAAPPDALTARERQVLHLISEGRTSKEIAYDLGISIKTVETHRSSIMHKLDLHDIPSLVRYAIRRGMIEA
jgi:DNA-binding NarL/FixJ family response regulator